MPKIYPRLESYEYEEKIKEIENSLKYNNNYNCEISEDSLEWLPIGDRVEISEIRELRKNIIDLAKSYNLSINSQGSEKTKFDRELGLKLLEWMPITPSIAADIGMWAYLNIILVPDLIKIRWTDRNGKIDKDRYIGLGRNYLGILWFSAYLCDNPDLYRKINSDWFIAWFERSSTRGFPYYINRLYEYINPYFSILKNDSIRNSERELFRPIMKIFKRKLGYINYFVLKDDDFDNIIKESVKEWVNANKNLCDEIDINEVFLKAKTINSSNRNEKFLKKSVIEHKVNDSIQKKILNDSKNIESINEISDSSILDKSKIDFIANDTIKPSENTNEIHYINEDFTSKKPKSFTIYNQEIFTDNWKDFYKKLCKFFLQKNSVKMYALINNENETSYSSNKEEFRRPLMVEDGFFIESNLSAENFTRRIKKLLEYFEISNKDFLIKIN